jgi:hypothetical protein
MLRCTSTIRHCGAHLVRLNPHELRVLPMELFTLPPFWTFDEGIKICV